MPAAHRASTPKSNQTAIRAQTSHRSPDGRAMSTDEPGAGAPCRSPPRFSSAETAAVRITAPPLVGGGEPRISPRPRSMVEHRMKKRPTFATAADPRCTRTRWRFDRAGVSFHRRRRCAGRGTWSREVSGAPVQHQGAPMVGGPTRVAILSVQPCQERAGGVRPASSGSYHRPGRSEQSGPAQPREAGAERVTGAAITAAARRSAGPNFRDLQAHDSLRARAETRLSAGVCDLPHSSRVHLDKLITMLAKDKSRKRDFFVRFAGDS